MSHMQPNLESLLEQLWAKHLASITGRISLLRQSQEQLSDCHSNPALRNEAAATAHKLAGVLGTFGLEEGTQLALFIEQQMESNEAPDPLELKHAIEALSQMVETRSLSH
ncbi:Hpt domain-containing protein [Acidipila rosea]|uniref:Hpt domain-containing protein n=2 Tax=Acidipila rosea TaxID=768535 RepID=A0A4R1LFT9_9BACT|nr:Hpt domain-containing protein [Acidipila rosea]